MNAHTGNSQRISISCRLLATDQWLRTHVSVCVLMQCSSPQTTLTGRPDIALHPSDSSIEDVKIHLLELCLGTVYPRATNYNSPIVRSTDAPSPAMQEPGFASLRIDTKSTIGSDAELPFSTSAASPVSPPMSPVLDLRYPRVPPLRPQSSQKQFKRSHSGRGGQAGQPENSDDDGLAGDAQSSDWPIFANEPEYEYLSDNPSFDNRRSDSPLDGRASSPVEFHHPPSSPVATTTLGRPATAAIRKPSPRVAFQSQSEPRKEIK